MPPPICFCSRLVKLGIYSGLFFPISRIKRAGEVVLHGPNTVSGTHKCFILPDQKGLTRSQASYRKEGGQVVENNK